MNELKITDLHVQVEEKAILRGVNLLLQQGQTHALMGPNGSGKSTLGLAIMGHPKYEITAGSIELNGQDVLTMSPDERSRAGIFMAFQRPVAIPGVKMADFLRHATTNVRNPERKEGEDLMPMKEFRKELRSKMEQLRMETEFARRYVNDGFSGGEMKRAEILQLAMLQPKFAILDETDSGLDADAVRLASRSIADIGGEEMGLLIITHHDKLLVHNPPDFTHVMLGGRIVETGSVELAEELHSKGYERIRAAYPDAEAENQAMVEQEVGLFGERINQCCLKENKSGQLRSHQTRPEKRLGTFRNTTFVPSPKPFLKRKRDLVLRLSIKFRISKRNRSGCGTSG